MTERYMVCDDCLKKYFGNSSKCCGHGWDILRRRHVERACSKCGEHATSLNCPDGPEIERVES